MTMKSVLLLILLLLMRMMHAWKRKRIFGGMKFPCSFTIRIISIQSRNYAKFYSEEEEDAQEGSLPSIASL